MATRIAIASDDESTIASHFGRTKGFVIYDVTKENIAKQEYRPNTLTGHARGLENKGHMFDRHGPILNVLNDCTVVISHGMGRRIYADLKSAGIDVYVTAEIDVRKAVELYISGDLTDEPERSCSHDNECKG
jgi:predicted Fe-Mo cluster-binding NifX family protein